MMRLGACRLMMVHVIKVRGIGKAEIMIILVQMSPTPHKR